MIHTQLRADSAELELRSMFRSGEDCHTDPYAVSVRLPIDFVPMAQNVVRYMQHEGFNVITLSSVQDFVLFDERGGEIRHGMLQACHPEILNTGHVRFVFPFMHARDEGYTVQTWDLAELEQVVSAAPTPNSFAPMRMKRKAAGSPRPLQ